MRRRGSIAILGRANAGKSTLLNSLIGSKVAAVSRKPQTTRRMTTGQVVHGQTQLAFIDSPGLHQTHKGVAINKAMMREAWTACDDSDYGLYLIDGQMGPTGADERFLALCRRHFDNRLLVLLTKADRVDACAREHNWRKTIKLLEALDFPDGQCLWISAKHRDSRISLLDCIVAALPEHSGRIPESIDQPRERIAEELIQEQVFRQMGKEIPFSSATKVGSIEVSGKVVKVAARILVARPQHKRMVIGKGGNKIKDIGIEARKSLETMFVQSVYLDLSVEVRDRWHLDQTQVARVLGLE